MAKNIFNSIFNKKQEDELVTKLNKNDLLITGINKGFKNYHLDSIKTCKLVMKYGLSKKVSKLCENLNVEFRKKFNLDMTQYLILSMFVANPSAGFNSAQILRHIGGRIDLLPIIYMNLFDLYDKELLKIKSLEGDVAFTISSKIRAYFFGIELEESKMTLKEVIREIDTIANLYNNQCPFCDIGEEYILQILKKNSHYSYCQILLDLYKECKEDTESLSNDQYKFAFYCLAHYALNGNTIRKDDAVLEQFASWGSERENILNTVFNGDKNFLFKNKILERGIDDSGKADKYSLEIHSDFKRKHLQGIFKEKVYEDVITPNKINNKSLYFNKDNQKSYDEFISMLTPKNFSKIKKRLKDNGARSGFASIFYGEPGTGKTEACYQIAKITGRDIIKIDMSSLRSKWWGEDEKNVKGVFSHYKSVLQDSKLEPILLLNEADAIIGKRLDVTGTNGAILTSINATQNIILDELETFEGILIATTNLTQNMDSAFERRFLHKIKFEKPNPENKAKIWKSLLKISEEDALILSNKYDFSGGNIENISRKQIVNNILYGEEYNINTIIKFCDEEKLSNKSKPIGFGS